MNTPLSDLFPSIPPTDLARLRVYRGNRLDDRWGLGQRLALLVVDMTRAFVEDDSSSAFVPNAADCAAHIEPLLQLARKRNMPVFYSTGAVFATDAEAGGWPRGRGMESIGSVNRCADHEVVGRLAPRPGEVVIAKPKPSAFFGTQLCSMLTFLSIDTVIITGVTTSGCVRATVNDAFSLNYRVVLPVECIGDRSVISHEVELFDMAVKYADVYRRVELMAMLEESEG